MKRNSRFTVIIFLALILTGCKKKIEERCNFLDNEIYPIGSALQGNALWNNRNESQGMIIDSNGLSMPSNKEGAFVACEYSQPFDIALLGESVTVSTSFTYNQVTDTKEKEILGVGLSNGKSEIVALFNRKGWGDYHSIGIKGYKHGVVMHTNKLGFKSNTSTGKSYPLRLQMSLTKTSTDTFNLVVILMNLVEGESVISRWEKPNITFEKGQTNELYGFIQNGNDDEAAGVSNRIITEFAVSNDKAYPAPPKTWYGVNFKDYILPMDPRAPLVDNVWGDKVIPRDTANGLEDTDLSDWCYWDGQIVKDDQSKYHMYASRWTQGAKHGEGWKLHSKAVHAVSDHVMGPYIDQGLIWPGWNDGLGNNVIGLRMHDGRYAVVTSERTRGEVFVSKSPNGPFRLLGEIEIDNNGFSPGLARYDGGKGNMSNVMIIPRPDGKYMIVPRSTAVMISENGILGPYKIMTGRIYDDIPEIPKSRMEDPTCWYSGGMYHMLVNHWPGKTTYHFSSHDGIHDWKYRGIAYRKDESIFRYTDGTVDEWYIVQRPTAYTENGHITHFNFSVIDVTKGSDLGNDHHGSKIIVVPFDGKRFDADMKKIIELEMNGGN